MSNIDRLEIFGYDVTYAHGTYVMSGGRTVERLPSTVVRITTNSGIEGFGEVCPLGATYLPAFGGGARAALMELGPALVGYDVRNLSEINRVMDATLMGHAYAKSAIDIACWDALGKIANQPVATLLGGCRQERFPLYIAIPLGPEAEMADHVQAGLAEGIHRFQLKLGADPYEDAARVRRVVEETSSEDVIIADANGGWRAQDAVLAARLLEPLERVFFEQPCPTLEECLIVRERTTLPMVLDEVIVDVQSLLRAYEQKAMEAINLKISRVGGLTKAKLLRELCESIGIRLTIEDTWGGDVTTAAISQLAASTSPNILFTVSYMNDWVVEHIAGYAPRSEGGYGLASDGAGLGIEVDVDRLGPPLATFKLSARES